MSGASNWWLAGQILSAVVEAVFTKEKPRPVERKTVYVVVRKEVKP